MSNATTYEGRPATFRANPIKVTILTVCTLGIYYVVQKITHMHTKVLVTPKGVNYETGVLRRETLQVPAGRLSTYKISQSLYERMFGLCTLEVYGAGDRPELVVNGLPDTQTLKAALSHFDK